MCKEDPILAFGEKIRSIWDPKNAMVCITPLQSSIDLNLVFQLTKAEWYNLRFEVMNEISVKMVPQTLITNVSRGTTVLIPVNNGSSNSI